MPAVLSELQGVQEAVFKDEMLDGVNTKVFDHFVITTPGQMTPAEYDEFVRDTVNFLDYASEPAQVSRRSIGKWAVLFMLALTWMAWLLKKEYWKDVH
jgi:ubiquinol-cytochrome c reductase cytochrome c1 subunit